MLRVLETNCTDVPEAGSVMTCGITGWVERDEEKVDDEGSWSRRVYPREPLRLTINDSFYSCALRNPELPKAEKNDEKMAAEWKIVNPTKIQSS